MKKIDRLRRKAKKSAEQRGHTLSKFQHHDVIYAFCNKCKMSVFLNPDPMPNEIEISGRAVALNCKARESV